MADRNIHKLSPADAHANPAIPHVRLTKYGLGAKQAQFVLHYLTCFNATKSAISAGYSARTASSKGCQLVRHPKVAKAIRELLDEVGLTVSRVKRELGKMVFGVDIADYEPWLRGMKTLQELRAEGIDTSVLEGVAITDTISNNVSSTKRQMRTPDKLAAIKLLMRICQFGGPEDGTAPSTLQIIFSPDRPPKKEGDSDE